MGQNTSSEGSSDESDRENRAEAIQEPSQSEFTQARSSELDGFANMTHTEQLVNINGIPSVNFRLEDVFSYEHYTIPELDGRQVWCFKVILEMSGQALVELRKTQDLSDVTALSYTWGETLRDERSKIGRYPDGSPCEVRLGYEWVIADFVSVLAQLSVDSWLWMDQIAKRPDMTSKDVISTFATVYSRCSVVVLLPGHDCPVAHNLKSRCLNAGALNYETAKEYIAQLMEHAAECGWYNPKVRWYSRVWTRQEALYARRIRIVHAGGNSGSCVPLHRDSPNSPTNAISQFHNVMVNIAEVLGTKMNSPDTITETSAVQLAQGIVAQVAFLLGLQLVRANNTPPLSKSLSRLAETDRKTTDAKDLIVSVWPGITFSSPIENWRSAYADIARHYEAQFHYILPRGLVKGATHDAALQTLSETPWGQVAGPTPSVRSLYSPFQYGQVGALRDEGTTYLQVAYDRVTVRPFPLLDSPHTAIRAVARYTEGLPVWMLRTWWRTTLNAVGDPESELLSDYETEASILFQVLTSRISFPDDAGRTLDTTEIEERHANETISGTRMAGLLVMCSTGTWGRDPDQLARCAGIVSIDSKDRICAGWPGTYKLGFGKGNGDVYGCIVTDSQEVYVRVVIPMPYHASQYGNLWRSSPKYYPVI
jgi:hypothetical protein